MFVIPDFSSNPPWGAQSVHRAVRILWEIAACGGRGIRLADLADAVRLERPTVHRIVKGLVAAGMVMQVTRTRTYCLGHLAYELGLASRPDDKLIELGQVTLGRLSERTGDSAVLVVQNGLDMVCMGRVHGSYPLQAMIVDVGERRPLGVGAAGMALLLEYPPEEVEAIIEATAPRLAAYGRLTAARLREALFRSRNLGFALSSGDVIEGVQGIGMAIMPEVGRPYAAISIASVQLRMDEARQQELAQLLAREIRLLERKLAARRD
jgi:DNA-binding IclR family transcriptional regulator